MVLPHSTGDLYHKYRPRRFGEIAGHKEVIASIKQAMANPDRPQVYLLAGSTGTGKTTTARIMAMSLNCTTPLEGGDPCLTCPECKAILTGNCMDMLELNAADHRGINDIRSICKNLPLMPMMLDYKVIILDEAHQLTNEAQSSLLKALEDAPKHIIFILCSTHASKILAAGSEMVSLLEEITTLEGEDLPRAAYEAIVDATGGSPRAAIVSLQKVLQLGSKDVRDILKLVGGEEDVDSNVIKVCFAIGGKDWQRVVEAYKEVKHIGAPAIGMISAGFYRNQLLKAKGDGAIQLASDRLSFFLTPFVDGKLGENQLTHALHQAWRAK
jgi:DNA polymerase-3 subunit gamma/tau